jgi:hypothetical protein
MIMTDAVHPSRIPFDLTKGFTWRSPREEVRAFDALHKVKRAMHSELVTKAARSYEVPSLDLKLNYVRTPRGLTAWMAIHWHRSTFVLGRETIAVPVEARLLCGPVRDSVLRDELGNFVARELGVTAEFDDEFWSASFKTWRLTLPPKVVDQFWGEFR